MVLTINGSNDSQTVHAGLNVVWPLEIVTDAPTVNMIFTITTGPDTSDAPDWTVTVYEKGDEIWSSLKSKSEHRLSVSKKKNITLEVTCPRGARYGDTVTVNMAFTTVAGDSQTKEFSARATQSLLILKTQANQEKSVANSIRTKVMESPEKDIYAILSPVKLTGYIFVEAMNTDRMREKTRGIRKARNFLDGETDISQLEQYFTPVPTITGFVEGDIVELADGPFKGVKARVKFIDEKNENITVELIEGMMPIPVTVRGESVRRIS